MIWPGLPQTICSAANSWTRGLKNRATLENSQAEEMSHDTDQERNNVGLFLDSSPDRWGRMLMQRRS